MRVNDAFVRFMTTSVIENKKTEKAKTVKKASKPERVAKKPVETEEVVAETKED